MKNLFDLYKKTAVITGGAGLLGMRHAEALMEYGANCILVDIDERRAKSCAEELTGKYQGRAVGICRDITDEKSVKEILELALEEFSAVDILINNAANNPKFEDIRGNEDLTKRFETFPVQHWQDDLAVGLTGAFLCTQIIGSYFAKQNAGVIVNIASDLGLIAPDQRIYEKEGLPQHKQPTKPVTYSVVKSGLIGLTKYTATYWAKRNVRCNALVPGGVYTGQEQGFVDKLTNLIPMGRMAECDEYQAAIVFLCSKASSYMTGASLVMEGGRTCW